MLVELGLVEQRYEAVCDVLAGVPVTEAAHFGDSPERASVVTRSTTASI